MFFSREKAFYLICTERTFSHLLCKPTALLEKNVDNVDNFVDNSLFRHFQLFQMWITFYWLLDFWVNFLEGQKNFVQNVDLKLLRKNFFKEAV